MASKALRVKNAWCPVMITLGNVSRREKTSSSISRFDGTRYLTDTNRLMVDPELPFQAGYDLGCP